MKNNILDVNYSMLLGPPWLQDVKVMHNWGNNLINIEANGIVHTITLTKHLDNNTKRLELLLCYDFVNGITDEEEYMLLAVELDLFGIGTIILLESIILATIVVDAKIDIDTKIGTNTKIGLIPKSVPKNWFLISHAQREKFQ